MPDENTATDTRVEISGQGPGVAQPKSSTTWQSSARSEPLLNPHYIFVRGFFALAVALQQTGYYKERESRWTLALIFRTPAKRSPVFRRRHWRHRRVWMLPLCEWTRAEL